MNKKERRATLLLLGFFVSALLSSFVTLMLDKGPYAIVRGLAQGSVLGLIYMFRQIVFNKWLGKNEEKE